MIHIKGIGCQFIHYGGINLVRPKGSGDYLLIFFRTDAEVMLEGVYCPIKANTFLIYPKGMTQAYRKLDGDFINDWMHFDLDQADYFQELKLPLGQAILLHRYSTINYMMYDLLGEFIHSGKQQKTILNQMANTMFHRFSDLYHQEKSSPKAINQYREQLTELRNRIYNFDYTPDRITDIAEDMHISLSYLEHLYKDIFGVTINQDLIRGRINHACILLDGTDSTISQVAIRCHYNNLEHFSRQFKKLMGCSPSAYRKKNHPS